MRENKIYSLFSHIVVVSHLLECTQVYSLRHSTSLPTEQGGSRALMASSDELIECLAALHHDGHRREQEENKIYLDLPGFIKGWFNVHKTLAICSVISCPSSVAYYLGHEDFLV